MWHLCSVGIHFALSASALRLLCAWPIEVIHGLMGNAFRSQDFAVCQNVGTIASVIRHACSGAESCELVKAAASVWLCDCSYAAMSTHGKGGSSVGMEFLRFIKVAVVGPYLRLYPILVRTWKFAACCKAYLDACSSRQLPSHQTYSLR